VLHLLRCKLHAVDKHLNITLFGNKHAFTGIQSYVVHEERPLQMFSFYLGEHRKLCRWGFDVFNDMMIIKDSIFN
jgi:hypothetical protein